MAASPGERPRTLDAIRALSEGEKARRISENESPTSLCRGDPATLQGILSAITEARQAAIATSTERSHKWAFKIFVSVCDSLDTTAMRPTPNDPILNMEEEIVLHSRAVIQAASTLSISSVGNALSGWCAVLEECGRAVPPRKAINHVIRGLAKQALREYGEDCLQRNRKHPFTKRQISKIRSMLTGHGVAQWSMLKSNMLWRMFQYLVCTGMRKSEVAGPGSVMHRGRVCYFLDGERVTSKPSELANLLHIMTTDEGNHELMVRVLSLACKNDALNTEFGDVPMWFRYSSEEVVNLARALLEIEVAHPVEEDARSLTPLFADPDSKHSPARAFTLTGMDADLKILLALVMNLEEAAKRSWHSCRITLATLLKANDPEIDPGKLQLACRWKTVESTRTYGKVKPRDYADMISAAMSADADTLPSGATLPIVDPAGLAAELSMLAEEGPSSVEPATKQPRNARPSPRASTPSPPAAADLPALTAENAEGREVLVPSDVWPKVKCRENNGTGWDAVVLSINGTPPAALLQFSGHSTRGREYPNERLLLSALQPR